MTEPDDPLLGWLDALERRHLQSLTFSELRRAVQAVNQRYVKREGPGRTPEKILDGAGKRAAFALYYAPLHALGIRRLIRKLSDDRPAPREIVDLGCGTGAGAIGWALACPAPAPRIVGIDRNPWTLGEARWNWSRLNLKGTARRGDLVRARLPGAGCGVVAAYAVNELRDRDAATLLDGLIEAAGRGARVLVVEPIARRVVPWWEPWRERFVGAGGREDLWRLPGSLPPLIRRIDRAAGLDHDVWTARSLWI